MDGSADASALEMSKKSTIQLAVQALVSSNESLAGILHRRRSLQNSTWRLNSI